MRVLISGASGMVGTALTAALKSSGSEVVALSRSAASGSEPVIQWNPERGELDAAALHAAGPFDAVVHLAGENVAGEPWTADVKRRIRDSRVLGTYLLSGALAELNPRPPVLISASATGYYGDRADADLSEASTVGDDFLATTCRDWEAATGPAEEAGMRVVHARFGIIQSTRGGPLQRLLPMFRMGAGGPLGSGRQWLSWVALADIVGAIEFLLAREDAAGAVNVVSPNPVQQREYARTLGRVLHRPALLPAPAFALRLVMGEMADALVLSSQRVLPRRLTELGFAFRYPELEPALKAAISEQ